MATRGFHVRKNAGYPAVLTTIAAVIAAGLMVIAAGCSPSQKTNSEKTGRSADEPATNSRSGNSQVADQSTGRRTTDPQSGAPGFFEGVGTSSSSAYTPKHADSGSSASTDLHPPAFFETPGKSGSPPGETTAAKPAGINPIDRILADQLFAKAKNQAAVADTIALLQEAIVHNPEHMDASLMLAQLTVDKKNLKLAVPAVSQLKKLVATRPDAPADLTATVATLEKELTAERGPLTRWQASRPIFAARYTALADTQPDTPLPSTVTALHRAAPLDPQNTDLAAQRDKAAAAAAKIPQPAEVSDFVDAKQAHEKGSEEFAAGRFNEARESLESAVSLAPRQCDYWCDLADCYHALHEPALAAGCLLRAKKDLANVGNVTLAKQLDSRIRTGLEQADSKARRVAEADDDVVKEAALLVKASNEIGDEAAASEIMADLTAMGLALPVPETKTVSSSSPATQPGNKTGPSSATGSSTASSGSSGTKSPTGSGSSTGSTPTPVVVKPAPPPRRHR